MSDIVRLLSTMEPSLHPGVHAYVSVARDTDIPHASVWQEMVAFVAEEEGSTFVLPEGLALALEMPILFRAAKITLTVHSELESVGLTAVVSSTLASRGISCNVVAGAYHDHLFVPWERAEEAMLLLRNVQENAQRALPSGNPEAYSPTLGSSARSLSLPMEADEYCQCKGKRAIKLMFNRSDTPLHCLDCNREIDPGTLPLTERMVKGTRYWAHLYEGIDRLWLDSGEYERWAWEQLSDIHSPINRRGMEEATAINTLHPCYYWLHQDPGAENHRSLECCPLCKGDFVPYNNGNIPQRLCKRCRIITSPLN